MRVLSIEVFPPIKTSTDICLYDTAIQSSVGELVIFKIPLPRKLLGA